MRGQDPRVIVLVYYIKEASMAKYTLDTERYDLDDIYAYTDTDDERLQLLNDPHSRSR